MSYRRHSKNDRGGVLGSGNRERGVALFIVVAAMGLLSVLVTEFIYVAQVNQRMAYDGADQVKAFYLAKSAYKLSLLRLRAYQKSKDFIGKSGLGAMVPRNVLDKIWSFPFFYPIPTDLPGMTMQDKDKIAAFQKSSSLDGMFSSVVEPETSRYNLNQILQAFAPTATPSPSPSPSASGAPQPSPSATAIPFDPVAVRQGLFDYLNQMLQDKFTADEDFAVEYRDFRLDDFVENLVTWIDRSYQGRYTGGRSNIKPKRAPLYSLSELHMIHPLDDGLYELFAPALTVSLTPGINVNTVGDRALKALVPGITVDESKAFYEWRDNEEEDHSFKSPEEFYKYLQDKIGIFRGDPNEVRRYRENLAKRNIRIVTDESQFKITVRAQVNQASQVIEAWVTLLDPSQAPPPAAQTPSLPGASTLPIVGPGPGAAGAGAANVGLRVTFMRIL